MTTLVVHLAFAPFYGSDVLAVMFQYSDGGDSFRFMAKWYLSFRLNMRALTHFIQIGSFINLFSCLLSQFAVIRVSLLHLI